MKFDDNVVAIGLQSSFGLTKVFEIKTPDGFRGLTLDQIIFIQDIDRFEKESRIEWMQVSMAAVGRSKLENSITRLIKR